MKYNAVIFDWDGTLGKTLHLWLEGYSEVLKKMGLDYPREVIIRDFFYEHDKMVLKYPVIDLPVFMEQVSDYVAHHIPSLGIYEGAEEALEELLKNNIKLTLVSSSQRRLLKEELAQHGLSNYFPIIVAGDDVMKHKPDPEPFLNVIEIAKLDPKTTIALGDSNHDIAAAKAAGIDCCLFLPPENKMFYNFDELKNSNPNYFVESLKEFTELLKKV